MRAAHGLGALRLDPSLERAARTARGVVAAWLASTEHCANLLRPSCSRAGVGDLVGAFQGHGCASVVTADFAG